MDLGRSERNKLEEKKVINMNHIKKSIQFIYPDRKHCEQNIIWAYKQIPRDNRTTFWEKTN
jgi:GTP1/Obg family GTP-binding protein